MIYNILIFNSYNPNNYFSLELIGLILAFAIFIDLIFGELPVHIHPVVMIGKSIDYLIKPYISIKNKISGILLTFSVVFVSFSVAIVILLVSSINFFLFIIISILLLSSMFSFKFLLSSANDIKNELLTDIAKARTAMSYLVSRKTDELSEKLIISAVIETLTENITDSCASVFFYYLFSGIFALICILLFNSLFNGFIIFNNNIVGNILIFINNNLFYFIASFSILSAIFYRAINTLDAMVGYKNKKYSLIGWFPAKLDDLLNYIPSRFVGLMVVISAFLLKLDWRNSYFILKRDWNNCPSPNSGYTMAAAAGALDVQLKKEGVYTIGDENQELAINHIDKAVKLSKVSIFLSLVVLLGVFYLVLYFLI
jgi:adenosylcobinamide-phosphate synthase